MKPESIDVAILEYSGWNAQDAAWADMTDEEIRNYFSQANFTSMFGDDGDISDWPWSFRELADRAIELLAAYRSRQAEGL